MLVMGKNWVYVLRCHPCHPHGPCGDRDIVDKLLNNGRWYIGETGRLNMRMLEHLNGKTKCICDTPPGFRLCVYDVNVNACVHDLMFDIGRPKWEPKYYPEGYNTDWWKPPYSKYNRSMSPKFSWGLLKYRLNKPYVKKERRCHTDLEQEITMQFMEIGKNDELQPRGAGWCRESTTIPTTKKTDLLRPQCHCGYPCEVKCNLDRREIYHCCPVKSTKWLGKHEIEHQLWVKNTLVGCSFKENIDIHEPNISRSCMIDSD